VIVSAARRRTRFAAPPTPGFFVTVDSTGGLSRVFLDLLILEGLQARFADLFISVELVS
jgi:hypothetical protein